MSSDDELPCEEDGQNSKADRVNDSSSVVELILHVHEGHFTPEPMFLKGLNLYDDKTNGAKSLLRYLSDGIARQNRVDATGWAGLCPGCSHRRSTS